MEDASELEKPIKAMMRRVASMAVLVPRPEPQNSLPLARRPFFRVFWRPLARKDGFAIR